MDKLIIAGRTFTSRLMVGTGKFASNAAMVAAMEGSGCEIVTVALRRVDIDNPQDSLLHHIDAERFLLLPNTSGARDAEEAIRLAR
ncbi:MAG: thiazole synthase, partial [Desulfuromonadales bacterium]|nr:thiazole synthase [Desulfuromonadales bacterium]